MGQDGRRTPRRRGRRAVRSAGAWSAPRPVRPRRLCERAGARCAGTPRTATPQPRRSTLAAGPAPR
eukprot:5518433-Alexandrium_andersonii.AAC.1